ncbi:MAG: hypothetical protein V1863_05830 [Candidatus Omnitrophota bacterium]
MRPKGMLRRDVTGWQARFKMLVGITLDNSYKIVKGQYRYPGPAPGVFIFCLVGAACLCGCATVTETGKKIWGSSIEHLERQRPQAAQETFDLSLQAAF